MVIAFSAASGVGVSFMKSIGLLTFLATTFFMVGLVHSQGGAPADWDLVYKDAAIYPYGSRLSCSKSGDIRTSLDSRQVYCAGAFPRVVCDTDQLPEVAKWSCLLDDPNFIYDIYQKGSSNLYYFQFKSSDASSQATCLDNHCGYPGGHVIQYPCYFSGSQVFELQSVSRAPGCPNAWNKVFRIIGATTSFRPCLTTGPEHLNSQVCTALFTDPTQTFLIRPNAAGFNSTT